MTYDVRLLMLLGILFTCFLQTAPAQAQATRTWISGVGDDANPCSRTAPCKTFAGAISKTATGGEIDALDPGGFGALTITKPITLDGGGGQVASVLVAGTNGIVVAAGSGTVILRNLRINGISSGLDGVLFSSGSSLLVENCEIFGFTLNGIHIAPSTGTSHVVIQGTTVYNNTQGGLQVKPTGGATTVSVTGVQANSNGFGIGVDTTGGGTASTIIDRTTISENSGNGIQATGANSAAQINNSTLTHNTNGVNITSPADVRTFTTNVIVQNSSANVVGNLVTNALQ
jgi:hypothetical protein